MIYYFAYGSNLHPGRLQERIVSAELQGVAMKTGHTLAFNKRGSDGSSKCNIVQTGNDADLVYGAVYRIDMAHKQRLDDIEGRGYYDDLIELELEGIRYECFTYQAQQSHITELQRPYDWYKQIVHLGAQYLQFPGPYINRIQSIESVQDFNTQRKTAHENLLERLNLYGQH